MLIESRVIPDLKDPIHIDWETKAKVRGRIFWLLLVGQSTLKTCHMQIVRE